MCMSMFTQVEVINKVLTMYAVEPQITGLFYVYDRETNKRIKTFKSPKRAARWCSDEARKMLLKEKQQDLS